MCGILGVLNVASAKDGDLSKFMGDGLIVGSVRGQDGTGIFQIDKPDSGKEFRYKKDAVIGNMFLQSAPILKIVENTHKAFLTVAHHRAATNGTIERKNCHPFVYQKLGDKDNYICGVHNGTLSKWDRNIGKVKFEVDSEWAIHQMAVLGVEEALKTFEGAWAFAVYDSSTPTKFYLASNGTRPLHFCFVGGGRTVLVASEARMLYWLAERNRLSIKNNSVFSVGHRDLITFDSQDPEKYTKKYIPAPSYSFSSNDDAWDEHGLWKWKRPNHNRSHSSGGSYALNNKLKVQALVAELAGARNLKTIVSSGSGNTALSSANSYVRTTEERYLTKSMRIALKTEGLFRPVYWDKSTNILHGDVTLAIGTDASGDLEYLGCQGQIRNCPEDLYKKLCSGDRKDILYTVRAMGAFKFEAKTGTEKVVVLSHPLDADKKMVKDDSLTA